ncbi:sodium/hydrogen exchanger 3-like isoform X2 [Clavelina lepadiformis]|uniref:sodium/hydrogen exchanger 3-like isoform X2 n=1 Tax=Clavelina lepadiformis TaxID=159417 RepID=UPI004041997C
MKIKKNFSPASLLAVSVLLLILILKTESASNSDGFLERHVNRKLFSTDSDAAYSGSEDSSAEVNSMMHDAHEPLQSHSECSNTSHGGSNRFPVATVNWQRVSNPYIIALWIIGAGMVKILFHLLHKVVSRVPESCVLICFGLIVGGIAYSINKNHRINELLFNPDTFFLFILPPIVMEAGYFMPKEPFLENLGTILTYAIIGTIFNALAIGGSLYGVYQAGWMPGLDEFGKLDILHCLLFGSIISAVDPVAVISVFEEIHVNTILYICVFGESLLNDGVAVVLFKVFEEYIKIGVCNIIAIDIAAAIASFFVVAFGGLFIGLIFGYVGSFITKFTVHNRIVEPTFVFILCYLSYLTAEIFHLSGIIAIVFAAFTMSSYVEHNISSKSHTTVKYGMKMLANIAETIIFMLLGISAVSDFWQYWNTGFVLWTLFFITIYRAIGVVVLTFMVNYVRLDKINKVDQFVMAYGGLRGGIAFSLVSLTSADHVPTIKTMICACIVAILFTSFVQGSTIRPIVELLKVKTADKHKISMFEDINLRLIDHLMAGIEDVTGHHGHHYWMAKLHELNTKYLAKIFTRDPYKSRNEELLETFHRINKRDAEEIVQEIEKGNSYGELAANGTFANLLMPLEMRKSYSQASFSNMIRQRGPSEACIDMHAFEAHDTDRNDATIHHLLEENMYKPRSRETTRYRRGNIDDDSERKKQETEIFLRHKLTLRRRPKHYKHKHNKHKSRTSSKTPSPLTAGSKNVLKPNNTAPSFSQPQMKDENKSTKPSSNEPDEGITFSVPTKKMCSKNGWNFVRDPLGFLSSFETLPEEPASDEEVEETGTTQVDSSVALDRELPWKRSNETEQAVCDPHNTAEPSKSYEPETSHSGQLWPCKSDTADKEDGEKANTGETPAKEMITINIHGVDEWDKMSEDRV